MNLTFEKFKSEFDITVEDICREYYLKNRETINIKKEAVAIKNLTTILNTTLRLSNDKGFQAMTLRDLSRGSGLSMGALYTYFTSKDELFRIIHNHGMDMITMALVNRIQEETDPVVKLRKAISIHLYLSELMHQWFYFLYMETRNLPKDERKLTIESELFTEQIFINILKQGVKEGIYSIKNVTLTSAAIKALLQDWYLKRWKYSKRKTSIDQYSSFVINFIEASIKP
ncbi:MAG TPA: helix-turn-helix domain-containing protein [Spirochaetota bacterium]|nr:helix-turn-helix domain-containing protein [Spirochaetota bacterium]HPF07106.1 helix-turn-helix domain-containing protein [Spirochaetota bacterium]HPJ43364.1 helix-turn-helix domain-containing protein [Spirochaetota bacterium]HPR37517.1 helix-turn-helix domain-containing protein [Spirochaetota bacterium]HRX48431.1 helix-turn-helix domain-containing protein [Spirochaetota bacterium]